jgi:hypothetical protein
MPRAVVAVVAVVAVTVVAVLALGVVGGALARSGPAAASPTTAAVAAPRVSESTPPAAPVCLPGLRCNPASPTAPPGPRPGQWLADLLAGAALIILVRVRMGRPAGGPLATGPPPPLFRPPQPAPSFSFA